MVFQGSLANLLTDLGETGQLAKVFLQALEDHGGTQAHLNGLLADAKGSRQLMNEIAKRVVGRIWRLAEEPVDLGLSEEDFRCSAEAFLKRRPSFAMFPHMRLAEGDYTETIPRGQCRYRLFHSAKPLDRQGVLDLFAPDEGRREHASWRELVAYVERLTKEDLSGCIIHAGGSYRRPEERETPPAHQQGLSLVAAYNYQNRLTVTWNGIPPFTADRLGPSSFYLVREYL